MTLRQIALFLIVGFLLNFGISPIHSMNLSEPDTPFLCAKSNTVSVNINAQDIRHAIDKNHFGGKIMKETGVFTMYKNIEHLAKLSPGFWIWTQSGSASSRYRWDTHEALTGGYETNLATFKASCDGAIIETDGANTVGLEYWKSTDMRHCAYVHKVAGANKAYFSAMFDDEDNNKIPRYDVHNVRLDFMVDEDVAFVSDTENPWCLLSARNATHHNNNYMVYLDQDLRIHVKALSSLGNNNFHETELTPSTPLTRGQWHTLEVRYLDGSTSGEIRYYIDGVEQDSATGLDTSHEYHTGTIKVSMGCSESPNSAGKIYFDAVRISDSYIGTDPGDPRDFIGALHFDSSAMTLDDFAYFATETDMNPVVQVGLFPPGSGHDYMTPQFSADMVEYLNEQADANYAAKAKQLDYTHNTPLDNWANLRAARGHVKPYCIPAVIMASEPYWCEGWPRNNPALYAQACLEHATKIKEMDPNIGIGVHLYNVPGWSEAVLQANKDILNWVCVRHDYSYEQGVSTANQIPRLLGIAAARHISTGQHYIKHHSPTREIMSQYLAHRPDVEYIPTVQDEHGFNIVYGPGEGADLGQAIYRLGYRLETIEQAGPYAYDGDWLVITDRGYTYGVIGSDSLTPSYWAYRLFYERFGTKYLDVSLDSPTYQIPSYLSGEPLFTTPYISVYASLNDDEQVMNIIIINRHQNNSIDLNFNISNFLPTFSFAPAAVYKIGGIGKTWASHNLDNPGNVNIEHSTARLGSTYLHYSAEPLSITAIEICKNTPSQPMAGYLDNNQLLFFWNPVPNTLGYVLEWGPSPEQPYGGTEKYPGGRIELDADTLECNFTMKPEDTIYATLRAIYANGKLSTPSPVSEIKILPKPANFRLERNSNQLIFRWDAVPEAAGYLLSCGTSTNNLYQYQMDVGTATEITINPDLVGTFHFIITPHTGIPVYGQHPQIITVTLP